MSEFSLKKIVKQKAIEAAFKYMMEQKNKPGNTQKLKTLNTKSCVFRNIYLREI